MSFDFVHKRLVCKTFGRCKNTIRYTAAHKRSNTTTTCQRKLGGFVFID